VRAVREQREYRHIDDARAPPMVVTYLQALDAASMRLKDAHHLAGVHVPLANLAVGRAGHNVAALELAAPDGREAVVSVGVARQRLETVAGLRVPHAHRAVVAAADELVGVHVDTRHPAAVATKLLCQVLASRPVTLQEVLALDCLLPVEGTVVRAQRHCTR